MLGHKELHLGCCNSPRSASAYSLDLKHDNGMFLNKNALYSE